MGSNVIIKIADNIISPLGMTTAENFEAVVTGRRGVRLHPGAFGVPEDLCGALLDRNAIRSRFADLSAHNHSGTETATQPDGSIDSSVEVSDEVSEEDYTVFEQLCILSASEALSQCAIDPSAKDVIFVISTTKGNVECLEQSLTDTRCYLAHSASQIAKYFGNANTPVVASNACISGVCAQIAAVRALLSGKYRHAVVIGADMLSRFIVSGFQSFKALSPEPCRPYDRDRIGLNLGEAAATIILSAVETSDAKTPEVDSSDMATTDSTTDTAASHRWVYTASSIHNDANHISGPSRTGEGSYRVLRDLLRHTAVEDVAFVNVHGTSTPYNDEMESIALHRAGLDRTPVNALKGYYGHTLGAAGVLETIISMQAVERQLLPATVGYEVPGTSYEVNISNQPRAVSERTFFKILSGFGGSNAGISYRFIN